MTFLIRNLWYALLTVLTCDSLLASDSIERIAYTWRSHFGLAAQSGHYHYRCQFVQRPGADVSHSPGLKPEFLAYDVEVFRLGNAIRHELRRHGSSDKWIEIYDGQSKLISQYSPSYWHIYTGRAMKANTLSEVLSVPDPLHDVLGLEFPALPPLWQLGMDLTHAPFDLPAALASQDFRIASRDAQVVNLVDTKGDKLVLSIPRHYGIVARTWKVQTTEPLAFSLQNSEWKTFANGMSFPALSMITCRRELRKDVLYTIEFKFTAMDQPTRADFRVLIDTPGTNISFHGGNFDGGGSDFRCRRVSQGEKIDLNAVANGSTSIRWDSREWPPFTFWEPWNVVPLFFAVTMLWSRIPSTSPVMPERERRVLLQVVMLLTTIGFVTIHVAMFVYEGGTIDNQKPEGYSWTHNFLSDLGRDCACYDFFANTPANHLFLSGMTLAGMSMGVYMWVLPSLFTSQVARRCAVAATVPGIGAAWCFIRVGWEPLDRNYLAHQWYAQVALLSFACTALLFAVAIYQESSLSHHSVLRLLLLAGFIVSYLLIRHFDDGRTLLGTGWLLRQAVAQKLIFYAIVAVMMLQVRESLTSLRCSGVIS